MQLGTAHTTGSTGQRPAQAAATAFLSPCFAGILLLNFLCLKARAFLGRSSAYLSTISLPTRLCNTGEPGCFFIELIYGIIEFLSINKQTKTPGDLDYVN
jgi:hypothetical protein